VGTTAGLRGAGVRRGGRLLGGMSVGLVRVGRVGTIGRPGSGLASGPGRAAMTASRVRRPAGTTGPGTKAKGLRSAGTSVADGTSVVPAVPGVVSVAAGRIAGPVVASGGRTRRRPVRVATTR
jgi:hypothetical protein